MFKDFDIPREVPVMTLPDTVFFPHVIMPLLIFEPRYRKMIFDVLGSNCLFAVAGLDKKAAASEPTSEPLYQTASLGLVRACYSNKDGTSKLFLQGLCRIKIDRIVQENPYRLIAITPVQNHYQKNDNHLDPYRQKLLELLEELGRLGNEFSLQLLKSLEVVKNPEVFIDLAADSFQIDPIDKQRILETFDTKARYQFLISKIECIRTKKKNEDFLGEI
ncbi:MAG: Lon protease 2 [Candidatus Moanabacter tarae]|uniref:Lon protease 2 n=1 Tax=Candidatus Moanibacter tarae TaxID=2200854 RepID=A0A2Z4ALK2_9BACT|nr:MAG: Lon protease 2 [Candidatus Moanabacter tarae]|tara:strand:- start:15623 stop:16279 length:657 start_codon:yes stop_codon:yes gene_type:complete